ncbi:MAG TPA: hypothetical protein VFE42_34180 [Chloroflexota bacterium]|nr:hypothetical protein [Chloroflexota bacterium]
MPETMENLTIRLPRDTLQLLEELARRDQRHPDEWARVQIERAIDEALDADESGDVPHETVVAEMIARGMITPQSEESAAIEISDEEFRRAQEAFDRGEVWW